MQQITRESNKKNWQFTRCINPPCSNSLPLQGIQVPIAYHVHDKVQLILEACPATKKIGNRSTHMTYIGSLFNAITGKFVLIGNIGIQATFIKTHFSIKTS